MADAVLPGFRGEVLLPGAPGYDQHRQVWNAMVDRRPAIIARCTSVADVVRAVGLGRASGMRIGVRCGGHGILGTAVPEGGLMLDLTPMGEVRVDPGARLAFVGGGALLRALDRAAAPHGLATTAGEISHTGVGGLTLGGGFGWLARQLGMSCDNVESYQVVLADGSVVRASASKEPDLFWALRGGGGNFGVVTEFAFRLHPMQQRAVVTELAMDAADGLVPLQRWRDLLPEAPRPATLQASVGRGVDGRARLTLSGTWVGDPEAAATFGRVFRSVATGVATESSVRELSYVELQTIADGWQGHGRRRYSTSHYLPALPDAALEVFLSRGAGESGGGPHWALPNGGLEQHGGAVGDVPDADAAYTGRDALVEWSGSANWLDPAEDAARIAAARAYGAAMRPFARGVYVNNVEAEGAAGARRAYTPEKLARLQEVKRLYDPDDVLRGNQPIPLGRSRVAPPA